MFMLSALGDPGEVDFVCFITLIIILIEWSAEHHSRITHTPDSMFFIIWT